MSGGGFPQRPELSSFGPTLQNAVPVRDPERELDALVFNLMRHQVAGMGLLSPRVLLKLTVANPLVLIARAEVWNPRGLNTGQYADPTLAFVSTGRGTIEYPATIADELGEDQPVAFAWGLGWYSADPPTVRKSVQVEPIAITPNKLTVCVFNASDALENGNNVWVAAG